MPYITGSTHVLAITNAIFKRYKFSPKHRGAVINDEISKWSVTHNSEAGCFIESSKADYIDGNRAWGFVKTNHAFTILGRVNIDSNLQHLKFAKFTEDQGNLWHGYPCYFKRKGDKPTKKILSKWVDNNIITKKEMSKISSYQKCNL